MPQTEFPLPVELVVKVLTCASDEAVLACRLVSQKLRSIIDRSIILQYRLRLSATGMRDGPAPLVDLTERYEMLKKYEDALSGMAWTTHTLVSTPNSIFPAVFISGAVIAMMSDSDLGDIIFQRIPCNLRGIPTSQWRVRLGFRALNITMDASQDLIVVPEYRHLDSTCCFRFLRMSDGQPHPAASQLQLHLASTPPWIATAKRVVSAQYFGVFCDRPQFLTLRRVWNWKTGVEVAIRLPASRSDDDTLWDTHLRERCVIVLTTVAGHAPALEVGTLVDPSDQSDGPETAARVPKRFLLPALSKGAKITDLIFRIVLSSCSERLGYFDPDPSHAFLAVEMEIERRTDRRRSSATRQRFNITISVNPLVPLIDEHPSPTIPWDEWGPDRSRLSRAPIGSRFPLGHLPKFHACGTRYSSGPQTRGQDSADIVRVWDTHPRRVMKSLAFQPTGTAIQQGSVFQDSYLAEGQVLRTNLPVSVSDVKLPQELQGLSHSKLYPVLSEDALLVFEYQDSSGMRLERLHVCGV